MKRYRLFTVFISGMTTLAAEQRHIVVYLDSVPLARDLRQARLTSLRELQSKTGEELSALLPSDLDKAFQGEL